VDLSFETLDLKLHAPFTISRGTQLTANNVKVCLTDNGYTGLGEAAPSRHYGELQGSVLAFLKRLCQELDDTEGAIPIATLHDVMDRAVRLNPAAKAAVDTATYDLLGKSLGAPVYQILGLDPGSTPRTSYTIGIDAPGAMKVPPTQGKELYGTGRRFLQSTARQRSAGRGAAHAGRAIGRDRDLDRHGRT
jgi:L-alanine-DL-glutamate epimerase-like enolase superfamily enzyme